MDDLAQFCCQNPDCSDYGRRGGDHLSVTARYGKNKERRMLYCRSCKGRFSERKGTIFFGSRLPEATIVSLMEHVTEGCGVRKTGRLLRVNRNTVSRYSALAGEHAHTLHDELVAFSPADA